MRNDPRHVFHGRNSYEPLGPTLNAGEPPQGQALAAEDAQSVSQPRFRLEEAGKEEPIQDETAQFNTD
ncbi:hypothetical protein [Glutamicibacter protophormiae]|uniref:hypothetical protein n=1 Tax=Glutamicibacter protophormiae TaxID=37930 RepID=UPI00332CE899